MASMGILSWICMVLLGLFLSTNRSNYGCCGSSYVKTYTNYIRGLDSYNYISEIGFSGRSVRNIDPIQHTIRSILNGDIELEVAVSSLKPAVRDRIIRDLTDISQGVLPMWMPRKFKLAKMKQQKLIKALKHYTK